MQPHERVRVALIAQLVEHCTVNAKVVGSNPVQSLKFFSGHFSSNVVAAFASFIMPQECMQELLGLFWRERR